jgi:formylglycine-generating enzyme required for sulfatase activity
MRIASIEPAADALFNPALAPHAARWQLALPTAESVRAFMLETLESTLELLEKTPDEDDALHFFRVALFHEELRREQLLTLAQTVGLALPVELPMGMRPRDAILVPAATWALGASPGGFAFDVEKWAHEVEVPEFEIDAQPVNWSQYIEFVDEGGYDREELWHPEGWRWLQRAAAGEGRRGPRHVEQIGAAGGAVRQMLFGKPTRMTGSQSAMHVSWWEADAYARWAQRRLPTEVEWERAAVQAQRQGFRWGDVREWTAGTLRPWPGFKADAWTKHTDFDAEPNFGAARV